MSSLFLKLLTDPAKIILSGRLFHAAMFLIALLTVIIVFIEIVFTIVTILIAFIVVLFTVPVVKTKLGNSTCSTGFRSSGDRRAVQYSFCVNLFSLLFCNCGFIYLLIKYSVKFEISRYILN